ncbi:Helicase [Dactylellina cionopaga]|nr:Helicase [Dactylellina cionopaga]
MSSSSGRAFTPLANLPTLTQLYDQGTLDASIATPSTLPPSQKFNDMVVLARMDLTRLQIDAIVNAANSSLLGGGGIDGAIHHVAGDDLYKECLELQGCETGDAKITKGYRLPAKHVIHTVGPRYWEYKDKGQDPSVYLESCYIRSLDVARENGVTTIAFPCISTGIFGYPNREAAIVACKAVRWYLERQDEEEDEVVKVDEDKKAEEEGPEKQEVKETKEVEKEEKETEEKKEVEETKEVKEKVEEKAEEKGFEGEKKEEEVKTTIEKTDKQDGEGEGELEIMKKEDIDELFEEKEEEKKPFLCKIEKVVFCTFLEKDLKAYDNILPAYFPPVENVEGSLDKLQKEEIEKETEAESTEKALRDKAAAESAIAK